MDRRPQLQVVWRYRWWVALCGALAALLGYGLSSLATASYDADAVLRIIPSQQQAGVGIDQNALQQLSTGYAELARSTRVYAHAARSAQARLSPTAFGSHEEVSVEEGGLLKITSSDHSAHRAARFANAHAAAVVDEIRAVGESQRTRDLTSVERRVDGIKNQLNEKGNKPGTVQALLSEVQQLQARAADIRTRPTDSGRVIETATAPSTPASPKPLRNAVLAFIAGLVLAAVALSLRYSLSSRYQSSEEAAEDLELPMLGELPRAEPADDKAVEAFRALRTNAEFAIATGGGAPIPGRPGSAPPEPAPAQPRPTSPPARQRTVRGWLQRRLEPGPARTTQNHRNGAAPAQRRGAAMLVTSPEEGAGKTYVTSNLARAFAADGRRVIVVDTDLRRPTLNQRYGVPLEPGVTDALQGSGEALGHLEMRSVPLPPGAAERGGSLLCISAGQPAHDSSELLSTTRMARMIEELRTHADLVILDSPPVLGVADAAVIARHVDAVIFVVDARKSHRRSSLRAVQALRAVDATLLGMVFNSATAAAGTYYGYGYYQPRSKQPETVGTQT